MSVQYNDETTGGARLQVERLGRLVRLTANGAEWQDTHLIDLGVDAARTLGQQLLNLAADAARED